MPSRTSPKTAFADIPAELRQLILQGGSIEPDLDFLVCTAIRRGDDSAMPLTAVAKEADLVVRGMVCGGTLYVKHVYRLKAHERVTQFDPKTPHPETRRTARCTDMRKNAERVRGVAEAGRLAAEWYETVHRKTGTDGTQQISWLDRTNNDGRMATTPPLDGPLDSTRRRPQTVYNAMPIGHFFYADEATRKLYLSASYDEAKLLHDRHRLASTRDERDAPWLECDAKLLNRLQTRLNWRYEDIVDSDEFMLRPIKNGRANAHAGDEGTSLLLALSKDVKIYTDGNIIATLPILSKVAPAQPDDEFASDPRCERQLKVSNDKWLLCVPMDWVYHFQKDAEDHNHTMGEFFRDKQLDYGEVEYEAIDSTASRIDRLISSGFFDYRADGDAARRSVPACFYPKLRLTKRGGVQRRGTSHPRHAARNSMTIPGTSFDRVAPLLVACFLAQGSPAYDVKDPDTHEKLMRLSLDDAFQRTYGLNGPYVEETADVLRGRPAKDADAKTSGCSGIAELDLFGGALVMM